MHEGRRFSADGSAVFFDVVVVVIVVEDEDDDERAPLAAVKAVTGVEVNGITGVVVVVVVVVVASVAWLPLPVFEDDGLDVGVFSCALLEPEGYGEKRLEVKKGVEVGEQQNGAEKGEMKIKIRLVMI